MKFLKDNWIWIVAPILVFALIVAAVVLLGPDAEPPNAYELR